MKKIQLSIPQPCHADWDAMTQAEKGRFCASCQKTVIDFTNMSDRQLAQFFKRPPSSVCGRIYNGQLNRDIVIPKKRIPWIKYFFQFTCPAFVLFLKSCGVKESTTGKMKVESNLSKVKRQPLAMPRAMMTKITPIDTAVKQGSEKVVKENQLVNGEIMGDVAVIATSDTFERPVDTLDKTEIIYKPMDTVVVAASAGRVVMGGISSGVCIVESFETKQDTTAKNISSEELNCKVYPNPSKAGSLLTVSFEALNDFPEQIQVLSSSGQLISQIRQNEKAFATTTTIQVPPNASAGIYFVRLVTKNKKVKTTKIIVTK